MAAPKTHNETRDHNAGVDLIRQLRGFLSNQKRQSRRFFEDIVRHPRVRALLDEIEAVAERWHNQRLTGEREALDRMNQMHTPDFARQKAKELASVIAKDNSSGTYRMATRASH